MHAFIKLEFIDSDEMKKKKMFQILSRMET